MSLTHLESLESESIRIIWEVVATADNPVMLYSIGIDSPYEKPENPDIHIKSDELLPDTAAELILNRLIQKEII